ncbi:MAG: TonB-dependent receptor plug domain-containing protein [Acidobacteriota bacterium]
MLAGIGLLAAVSGAWGQQAGKKETKKVDEVRTTVVVVGTPDRLTAEESARSTAELPLGQVGPLEFGGVTELLRGDASVDLEARGGGGVQTDVTIRGGSFEQTLVLVNGFRVNDAETSHFNLDLPVAMDALASVNVLHGAGSTLYGSDAVSGVVDFLTATPGEGWALKARAGAGSYGENEQGAVASWGGDKASEVVAGDGSFRMGLSRIGITGRRRLARRRGFVRKWGGQMFCWRGVIGDLGRISFMGTTIRGRGRRGGLRG